MDCNLGLDRLVSWVVGLDSGPVGCIGLHNKACPSKDDYVEFLLIQSDSCWFNISYLPSFTWVGLDFFLHGKKNEFKLEVVQSQTVFHKQQSFLCLIFSVMLPLAVLFLDGISVLFPDGPYMTHSTDSAWSIPICTSHGSLKLLPVPAPGPVAGHWKRSACPQTRSLSIKYGS